MGSTMEKQLNEVSFLYINSLRAVQVIENKVIVSKIYDWFQDDFGGTPQYVLIHLRQFAKEPLKTELAKFQTIDRYIYNWHLNNVSTP